MSRARIVKNSIIFFCQSLLSLVISIFVNGYIARQLGSADYGVFIFAFSFATMFIIFADMGFHGWGVKQIAGEPEKTSEFLGDVITLRTFFSSLTFLLVCCIVFFSGFNPLMRTAIFIAITTNILLNIQFTNCWIVFEARESVKYEGLSNVGCRILVAVLSVVLMYLGAGVLPLAWAYLCGSLFQVIYCYYVLWRRFELPSFNFSLRKHFLQVKEALPFAFLNFFFVIYYEVDKIMLGFIQGDSAVGIYNAAAAIAYRAAIISSAITVACMPAMIQYYKEDKKKLADFIATLLPILMLIGLPISVCGVIYAKPIVDIIYHNPQYDPSILTMQIIVWMIPLEFISHFFRFALIASSKEKIPALIVGSGVAANLLMNSILIVTHSYNGAAFATVITEIFLVIGMIFYYTKNIHPLHFSPKILGAVLVNGCLFLLLLLLTQAGWSFWALLPSAIFYIVLLFVLRVIDKQVIIMLYGLFRQRRSNIKQI